MKRTYAFHKSIRSMIRFQIFVSLSCVTFIDIIHTPYRIFICSENHNKKNNNKKHNLSPHTHTQAHKPRQPSQDAPGMIIEYKIESLTPRPKFHSIAQKNYKYTNIIIPSDEFIEILRQHRYHLDHSTVYIA